ncbi:MAG: DivIVA domain-containing protein [Synergistaceae bacterium]|jgi:cell division initiation protein|nr:DivIVA domain-containing protein [Synergistaceae bacterium]
MPELLTAEDIERRVFKKVSFGGYSVAEIEEFLGQIIDDVKEYASRLDVQRSRIAELEESVKKYESMEATIKDALIMAQRIAQEKREEAERQAALLLAGVEAKQSEIDEEARSRLDEADKKAEEIAAAAHASVAQITQDAERMRGEAQKRFDDMDQEIERRLAEANDRVGQITANARLEARRMLGKTQSDIEENERSLAALRAEKDRFLRECGDLLSKFGDTLEAFQAETAVASGASEAAALPVSPLPVAPVGGANDEAEEAKEMQEAKDEAFIY